MTEPTKEEIQGALRWVDQASIDAPIRGVTAYEKTLAAAFLAERSGKEKAEAERNDLHGDIIGALIDAGICCPAEGYLKAGLKPSSDIKRLAKEMGRAKAHAHCGWEAAHASDKVRVKAESENEKLEADKAMLKDALGRLLVAWFGGQGDEKGEQDSVAVKRAQDTLDSSDSSAWLAEHDAKQREDMARHVTELFLEGTYLRGAEKMVYIYRDDVAAAIRSPTKKPAKEAGP